MSQADEFDDGTFLFSKPWILIPFFPPPKDVDGFVESVLKVSSSPDRLGDVALFTDQDLAERFLQRWTEANGRVACTYEARSFKSPQGFAGFLRALKSAGHTHVAVDPGETRIRRFAIQGVLDDLFREHPDAGSV